MIEATRWIQSTSGTSWQPDAFSWKNTPWLTSPSSHSRRLHCHHGSELNTIGQESQSFTQVVVNGAWTVQTATLGGWVESWQSFHLRWRDGYPAHLQGNSSFPPEWNVLFIAPDGPVKVDLARTVSVPP